jgi:hypothetical protein
MTLLTVNAVDYNGAHAYSRGSVPATVNLANVNSAVLLARTSTRNVFDDITRLHFRDGSHLDVFGLPGDFVEDA